MTSLLSTLLTNDRGSISYNDFVLQNLGSGLTRVRAFPTEANLVNLNGIMERASEMRDDGDKPAELIIKVGG